MQMTDQMVEEKLRRHRRRKRMARLAGGLVLLGIVSVLILFFSTVLTEIRVEGNENLTEKTVTDLIFQGKMDRRYYYALFLENTKVHAPVPMISEYELRFPDRNTAVVTVREKPMVGGVRFMDRYIYFDEDGYAVRHASSSLEGIPLITGLSADHPVLYEKIKWKEERDTEDAFTILRLLSVYGIGADRLILNGDETYELESGMISVMLGTIRDMEEKLSAFRDMKSHLSGLRGTLHLEEPNGTDRYYFDRE